MKVGRPVPVCMRVVHMAPGPTFTFTMSAPASSRSRVPSGVQTFPATSGRALPIARRGMAAALALAFVLLSNDFAVSVMLRTPGNQVLGTLLYEKSVQGVVPEVAVLSLIMTVITTVILLLTIRFGGKSGLQSL